MMIASWPSPNVGVMLRVTTQIWYVHAPHEPPLQLPQLLTLWHPPHAGNGWENL
jgi:hypothetical protein